MFVIVLSIAAATQEKAVKSDNVAALRYSVTNNRKYLFNGYSSC